MFPTSYSPKSGLVYGAGMEGCSTVSTDVERSDGKIAWNGGAQVNADRITGSITAMDPTATSQKAQHLFDYPDYSGVVSTAGGLVFTATLDGTLHALDEETLEELWTFNVGSPISSPPMTDAVDGKQYVAVLVGAQSDPVRSDQQLA